MRRIVSILALCGFVSIACVHEPAEVDLDYGDYRSYTIAGKAWGALGEGRYADAVKYTEKCAELYEDEARKMQKTLTAKPSTDQVHDYWALNDVGTCYFIRGEALTKLNKNSEALAAFTVVAEQLSFAQTWDPKGWFWSPADVASKNIKKLKYTQDVDF